MTLEVNARVKSPMLHHHPPPTTTMTAANETNINQRTLLNHIRSLVRAEQSLTTALSSTEALLHRPSSSFIPNNSTTPLLPLPAKSQVSTILAIASSYSTKTSAPPTWASNLPVVGFTTPNPLPHQLRGGALGAMQLKLAREELRVKKEMAHAEKERKMEQKATDVIEKTNESGEDETVEERGSTKRKHEEEQEPTRALSAKKNEMMERQKRESADVAAAAASMDKKSRTNTNTVVDMNLSDSSSEESDDED